MRVVREHDVARFLEKVGPRLRERPAENNLMLGLTDLAGAGAIAGREADHADVPPVLLTVEGAEGVEAVALQTLATWSGAFHRETRIDPIHDCLAFVRGRMAAGQLFVWDNGAPVSMTACTGRTTQGVRVGYVYTPPAERKKGYAGAAVAALSQRMLDEGSPRCFLFTDAANPTSNKICQALGYERVCDFRLYDFRAP